MIKSSCLSGNSSYGFNSFQQVPPGKFGLPVIGETLEFFFKDPDFAKKNDISSMERSLKPVCWGVQPFF